MTKEQYKQLSKYEKHLNLAYKSKELSALTSGAVLELATIFEQLGYHLDNKQCGHCLVQMCAKLGELYNNYKPEQKAKKSNKKNEKE
jgi:hypothetical protein